MKLSHFLVAAVIVMALVVMLVVAAVAADRDEQAALNQLHQAAMQGEPAAVMAYCDALVEEGAQGGRYADCVERAKLESFVTQSARWAEPDGG